MREKCSARFGNGRLITPTEIQLISGYGLEVAEKEHAYIRKALGTGSEDLLVSQYCDFCDLDYWEIMTFLSPLRKTDQDVNDENFDNYEPFLGEKND